MCNVISASGMEAKCELSSTGGLQELGSQDLGAQLPGALLLGVVPAQLACAVGAC